MAEYLTFNDILAIVKSAIKTTRGSSKDTLIGYLINQVYLEELINSNSPMRPFYWLLRLNEATLTVSEETITAITAANPGVITVDANTSFAAGDIIEPSGIVGMTELNGRTITVASVSSDEITTDIDTTNFTAYSSGGTLSHRGISLSDIDSVFSAGWNGYDPAMVALSPSEVENDSTYHNEGNTGRPTHYLYTKNFAAAGTQTDKLLWFPGADDEYRLRYWYVEQATRLATTVAPLLPYKHHEAIPAGVITRMIENPESKVKVENQSMWPAIYKGHLAALKKDNDTFWDRVYHAKDKIPYLL